MSICPRPAARSVWERRPRYFEAKRREQVRMELLPMVRRPNPTMPKDQVLKMAESMVELRILYEEIA
jgi:hypothetical protein